MLRSYEFFKLCWSLLSRWCWMAPMRTAKQHGALEFKVSFLKFLMFHHLPKIIINDGTDVVSLSSITSFLNQRFLLPYNFISLRNMSFQVLHMGAKRLKFVLQIGVRFIYLPIEVYNHLLLPLKNLINHWFQFAFLSCLLGSDMKKLHSSLWSYCCWCCRRVSGIESSDCWSYSFGQHHWNLCFCFDSRISDSENQYHSQSSWYTIDNTHFLAYLQVQ